MFTIIWALLTACFALSLGFLLFFERRRAQRQEQSNKKEIQELRVAVKAEEALVAAAREGLRDRLRKAETDREKAVRDSVKAALLQSWPPRVALVLVHRRTPLLSPVDVKFQLRVKNHSPHKYTLDSGVFSAVIYGEVLDVTWPGEAVPQSAPAILEAGKHYDLEIRFLFSEAFRRHVQITSGGYREVGFYAKLDVTRVIDNEKDNVKMMSAGDDGDLAHLVCTRG